MRLKRYFRKIREDKDVKTLAENFAWLSMLQIASYAFPFITMPYLAKVIGVEGFGKIAFAGAIMIWIQTIVDWGFNYTATRNIAKNRDDVRIVSEIFSNVLWARVFLMLISFVLLLLLLLIIPKFRSESDIILISFLLVPGHIMFPDWFFQAMERMKYITILNLTFKFLFTVLIFVFIRKESDYLYLPLLTSLGFVVSGVVAFYYILHKWQVRIYSPKIGVIICTLKKSFDVFLNSLIPNLYNSFSMILLGVFSGSVANGIIDAGTKIINLCVQLMGVVSRTFFPFLSRKISYHHKYALLNISIATIFSIGVFIFSPLFIQILFTEKFNNAIIVSRIMSISILFLALSNIYGTNYMIIEGYEQKLRNITFRSSLFGFIISFPLLYYFSYIGAAITVCITRGILGISIYLESRKIMACKN